MLRFHSTLAVTALAFLTACGGDGGSTDDRPSRDDVISDLQRAERAVDRLIDLPGTRFSSMPTAGTATFEGQGGLFIDPAVNQISDDINIFGDATMTADFRRNTIKGSITDLKGVQGANPATGRIFDVEGEIRLGESGSAIGAAARPFRSGVANDAASSFSGQLRTETNGTFDVNGVASGKFAGTREAEAGTPRAPKALSLETDSPSIVRNGREIEGSFFVFGEN